MQFIAGLIKARDLKQRIATNQPRLVRMAFAWGHNQDLANDIAQEAVSKALKKLDQLRDANALDSWMFGILVNCWRDHFRKQHEMIDIEEVQLTDTQTPEKIQQQQDLVDNVRDAISKLGQGQRQVVTLIDLEGFSYNEVSEILEIPVGTVMSRLSRARKQLSELLIEHKGKTANKEKQVLRRVK